MVFYIESPAILAPGLPDWLTAKKILSGQSPYQAGPLNDPKASIIPDRLSRRCSSSALLAIHVAEQTLNASRQSADSLNSVFASSVGDPEIDNKLCLSAATQEPMPSPTLFHNSVHNAPAGYWSIAVQSQNHTTSLAAGASSFAAGLLCAYTQMESEKHPILLAAYDQPLQGSMARNHYLADTFACSLLLTPERTSNSLVSCELELIESNSKTADKLENPPFPELNDLYQTVPAARALPLLALLAQPCDAAIFIDYNNDSKVSLTCHKV